jgi:hypothetical protein
MKTISNWKEARDEVLPTETETKVYGDQAQKTTWSNNGKYTMKTISNWKEAKDEVLPSETETKLYGDQA